MPVYAVSSKEQGMLATGIVAEVPEWEDAGNGKRRPSKAQAKDETTGLPLWEVEVLYRTTHFGRPMTVTTPVKVSCATRPEPGSMTAIEFEALRVTVVPKGGGFEERWSAGSIVGAPKQARQQQGGQ